MDKPLKQDMLLNNHPKKLHFMNVSDNKNVFKQKLESLHCPFSWKPKESETEVGGLQVLLACEQKLRGAEDEGEECTPWTKFVLNVVMCYEYAMRGSIEEALQKQDECQKILEDSPQLPHLPAMGIGLKHVCLACKIYLFDQKGKNEEVSKMLKEVKCLSAMEPRDQASIWAVRGAVFLEYGYKGQKESIEFIERAIELDSQCGEMHFLLGKALSRARRNGYKEVSSEKEVKSFELAVKLTGDKFCKVLLAQSYIGSGMCYKAFQIYKNVLEDENTNPYVLARVGFGLMVMPKPYQDLVLAEKIILKALQRTTNNGFLYITAGRLYLMKNNFIEAEKYFSKEVEKGNFEGIMWLINTREKKDTSYSPVSDLEVFMKFECYSETKYQNHILLLLGLYYFFKIHDFDKALEYWWKVIEADPLLNCLNNFRNPWKLKLNINTTVIKEISSRMRSNVPAWKKNMYMKVLKHYREKCPELLPDDLKIEYGVVLRWMLTNKEIKLENLY